MIQNITKRRLRGINCLNMKCGQVQKHIEWGVERRQNVKLFIHEKVLVYSGKDCTTW
jgi:hypothetical protein